MRLEDESLPSGKDTPLFIVGMPRSGTKLLRAILNQHPAIFISNIETEFFPFWVRHWHRFGSLEKFEYFLAFAERCRDYPFFIYFEEESRPVDAGLWFKNCSSFTPAGVFEALIRTVLNCPVNHSTIWGDKSPSYIRHMPLLSRHFPRSRFIHSVRDVRDYCVSINRAWGKNILRAAQRWNDDVQLAQRDGRLLESRYLEVRYEDLIKNPERITKNICEFLDVPYFEAMTCLDAPTENLGRARGATTIIHDNAGRFDRALTESDVRQIESLAVDAMISSGYKTETNVERRRLGRLRMIYYGLVDGVHLVIRRSSERGLIGAALFYLRYAFISGNRN